MLSLLEAGKSSRMPGPRQWVVRLCVGLPVSGKLIVMKAKESWTSTGSPSRLAARPAGLVALAGLIGILALATFAAAQAMLSDPLGPFGMTTEALERTPVDDYFWPGMFFAGLTLASALTLGGLMFDWRWDWAGRIESRLGYRWPWLGAMATGLVLAGFEVTELFLIPFHPVMHPLLIAWAVAIVWLALSPPVRTVFRTSIR